MRDPQYDHMRTGGIALLVAAMALMVVPVFMALAFLSARIGAPSIAIWGIAIWGGVSVFRGPVGKALATRISGESTDGPAELPAELYAELDELRARVGELEERVDFSERLLTSK